MQTSIFQVIDLACKRIKDNLSNLNDAVFKKILADSILQ